MSTRGTEFGVGVVQHRNANVDKEAASEIQRQDHPDGLSSTPGVPQSANSDVSTKDNRTRKLRWPFKYSRYTYLHQTPGDTRDSLWTVRGLDLVKGWLDGPTNYSWCPRTSLRCLSVSIRCFEAAHFGPPAYDAWS